MNTSSYNHTNSYTADDIDDTDYMNISHILGGGSGAIVHPNDHGVINKDNIVKSLIPNEISECALYLGKQPGDICMSDNMVKDIGKTLNVVGDPGTVILEAKNKLKCDTERCILEKLAPTLGAERIKKEITGYLKIAGPTDKKLLSNFNIDNTLQQWAIRYKEFFPYNFNMRNYADYAYEKGYIVNHPDTLATISFSDLYNGEMGSKYRCAGCIINTDTYQGEGKHWMALFADARDVNTWSVEFFNSSGNAPAPEWINWMEKTKNMMENIIKNEQRKTTVKMVRVTSIRHQQSKTECGLYSLFYIWARLHGIPFDYFMKNHVPDQLMFELRQHLFDSPNRKPIKKFNWDEYKNTVNIEWE